MFFVMSAIPILKTQLSAQHNAKMKRTDRRNYNQRSGIHSADDILDISSLPCDIYRKLTEDFVDVSLASLYMLSLTCKKMRAKMFYVIAALCSCDETNPTALYTGPANRPRNYCVTLSANESDSGKRICLDGAALAALGGYVGYLEELVERHVLLTAASFSAAIQSGFYECVRFHLDRKMIPTRDLLKSVIVKYDRFGTNDFLSFCPDDLFDHEVELTSYANGQFLSKIPPWVSSQNCIRNSFHPQTVLKIFLEGDRTNAWLLALKIPYYFDFKSTTPNTVLYELFVAAIKNDRIDLVQWMYDNNFSLDYNALFFAVKFRAVLAARFFLTSKFYKFSPIQLVPTALKVHNDFRDYYLYGCNDLVRRYARPNVIGDWDDFLSFEHIKDKLCFLDFLKFSQKMGIPISDFFVENAFRGHSVTNLKGRNGYVFDPQVAFDYEKWTEAYGVRRRFDPTGKSKPRKF